MAQKNAISEAQYIQQQNVKDFKNKQTLLNKLFNNPIPSEEIHSNLGLFIDRRLLSRYLFINELYGKIIGLHGKIFEFGVRYGQNLSLFTSLRGIYEPFNHNRKIVGFDTFEGFVGVDATKDPESSKSGDYAVTKDYNKFLTEVLSIHESLAPIEQIKKFELVKGDASVTLPKYLKKHQETIISLAYFDMDVYKPTYDCLKAIVPYLSKGAVIAFDELNDETWQGESVALREVLGTNKFKIQHSIFRAAAGYLIYE
jgi:hypothetical protein